MRSDSRDIALVTGASGFIGGAVASLLLEQGFAVRALVRRSSPKTNLRAQFEIVEGDVTDRDSLRRAMAGARYVFHVAADYRLWARDPQTILHTNVEGTRLVMEEALRAGVERIVHTSSVATLAPDAQGLCDETRRLACDARLGPYKRSKLLSERLVEEMIERDRLPAVIVNPSAPLGPGDVRPTPTGRIIVEAMRGNMPAYVDTGLAVVHVADVAAGHLSALQHGRIGERYILGGDNLALSTLLGEVARLSGRRPPRVRLPRWPLVPLAHANEALARVIGHEPFLNVESLRLSATTMFFDHGKAARELGYRPRPYRQALADAVDWFRAGARTEPRMLGEARGAHDGALRK
ncbi:MULTISPECIES: hopanoid-associated sugar epimerase [Methylosinus]|uniref:NAD-dependent dehydratase n=1 Tax=Methylosinus trichosporium (strain ATCC 35070 / NCIMB 11131 / UNIQEM 75 / OB3b) TaxID=595536 RepID=A0A2D2CUX5_METT3|nr:MULTISPECIES: hopanoid-associated sugar epimerase [Methylosinus]ATQ66476.1 NAD-dependent dehydratase [Methylosinus trichosporium OB3b]OBS51985.1 NAD-dependent dehydratase [Methylosinus sp. 3S-1]